MSNAICCNCGMHWSWRSRKGSRIADFVCSDCGGRLRGRRTGYYTTLSCNLNRWLDSRQYAWPLGTSPEERRRQMAAELARSGISEELRAQAQGELARAEVALAKAAGKAVQL